MTTLQIDFEFDFIGGSNKHQVLVNLDSTNADKDIESIKDIVVEADIDLSDEEELEELAWEIDDQIQYEIIYPKIKVSNFAVDEARDEVLFDLDLTLWGKTFNKRDVFYQAKDANLSPLSTSKEFEEAIMDSYEGTHHNFDITDSKITVLP